VTFPVCTNQLVVEQNSGRHWCCPRPWYGQQLVPEYYGQWLPELTSGWQLCKSIVQKLPQRPRDFVYLNWFLPESGQCWLYLFSNFNPLKFLTNVVYYSIKLVRVFFMKLSIFCETVHLCFSALIFYSSFEICTVFYVANVIAEWGQIKLAFLSSGTVLSICEYFIKKLKFLVPMTLVLLKSVVWGSLCLYCWRWSWSGSNYRKIHPILHSSFE